MSATGCLVREAGFGGYRGAERWTLQPDDGRVVVSTVHRGADERALVLRIDQSVACGLRIAAATVSLVLVGWGLEVAGVDDGGVLAAFAQLTLLAPAVTIAAFFGPRPWWKAAEWSPEESGWPT